MTVCFAFAAHLICLPEQWCVGDVLMFDCVVLQQWNSLIIFGFSPNICHFALFCCSCQHFSFLEMAFYLTKTCKILSKIKCNVGVSALYLLLRANSAMACGKSL